LLKLHFIFVSAQHSILSAGNILLLFFGAGTVAVVVIAAHFTQTNKGQRLPNTTRQSPQQGLLGPSSFVLAPFPPLVVPFGAHLACSCLNNFRDGERVRVRQLPDIKCQ